MDTTNVLFQKLGATWYAFSEIDGEVFFTELPENFDPSMKKFECYEVLEEHFNKIQEFEFEGAAA